jgi:predicted  nucleic acid-binding Zn-ribbon protein
MTKQTKSAETELTIEEKLRALFSLQLVDSEIDKIRTLRGELPLEVQDLEDEVAGLETRIGNLKNEISELEKSIVGKTNEITASQALIKKYEEQQNNVRNNREYDSLSKEIEFQTLEIELSNKKIREFTAQVADKKEVMAEARTRWMKENVILKAKRQNLKTLHVTPRRKRSSFQKNQLSCRRGLREASDSIQAYPFQCPQRTGRCVGTEGCMRRLLQPDPATASA